MKRATRMVTFISQDPDFEGITSPLPSDQIITSKDLENFVPVACAVSQEVRAKPTLSAAEKRFLDLATLGGPPPAERLIQLSAESPDGFSTLFFIVDGNHTLAYPTVNCKSDDEDTNMDQGTGPPPPPAPADTSKEEMPASEWEEDDDEVMPHSISNTRTESAASQEVITIDDSSSTSSEHGGPSRPPTPQPASEATGSDDRDPLAPTEEAESSAAASPRPSDGEDRDTPHQNGVSELRRASNDDG